MSLLIDHFHVATCIICFYLKLQRKKSFKMCLKNGDRLRMRQGVKLEWLQPLLRAKVSRNCLISTHLLRVRSRKRRMKSLQTPNFRAWGEPHAYSFTKKCFFLFLLILPAIHAALASKRIRTLMYNTHAYVAESPKTVRANLPVETRPYGAPRHSEHNRSRLSPLAPSPSMMERRFGYTIWEAEMLLWIVDAKLEQNWSHIRQ